MTVSILMPAKNVAPFLGATIRSILSQTYQDWELLVVDDHSTDASYTILQTWATKDVRIRPCTNKGSGIVQALETALASATGEFVTRMDADDIMPPHKLKQMVSVLQNGPNNGMATGKVSYFKFGSLGQGYLKYANWLNALRDKTAMQAAQFVECPIASPNWMMRQNLLIEKKLFESLAYPEDYDFALRALRAGLEILPLEETTHLWRDHGNRASRNLPEYSENHFLPLKWKHLNADLAGSSRTVGLVGAGSRGKILAKLMDSTGKSFAWYTNNKKKIGKQMEGLPAWQNLEETFSNRGELLLVCVSGPEDQSKLRKQFAAGGKIEGVDFYFFC